VIRVLGVHGIGNQRYEREAGSPGGAAAALTAAWNDSLSQALPQCAAVDLSVVYYANHLHRGTAQGGAVVSTLEPGAQALLVDWVGLLAPEPAIAQGPHTARARQAADWLTRRFGAAARLFAIAFCQEVHTYLAKPDSPRRTAARKAVGDAIRTHRPEVVVAHSLGSILAYETLWAHQEHDIDLLVTLGSPLAMPGIVLPRLQPGNGHGGRPPQVRRWVNLADVGDIVAIPRTGLEPWFHGVERDIPVTIGTWDFHTVAAYLRCPTVAQAIIQSRREP
jgi:hypothetical protein